jgi:hypothetical protein
MYKSYARISGGPMRTPLRRGAIVVVRAACYRKATSLIVRRLTVPRSLADPFRTSPSGSLVNGQQVSLPLGSYLEEKEAHTWETNSTSVISNMR